MARIPMSQVKLLEKPVEVKQLSLSPAVNASLQRLLLLFEQQFVTAWYGKFSATDKRFPEAVRLTLETVIMNAIELCGSKDLDHVFLIVFGISQAIIGHVREYREYENSKVTPREFYQARKDIAHCAVLSPEAEADHIRHIIEILLMKFMPSQEFGSNCMRSLLAQILTSSVFQATVDQLTDPDFINQTVVKMFDVEEEFYQLEIKVMETKGFVEYGTADIDSPYVSLSLDGQQTRTKKGEPPKKPAWNQSFFL